MVEIRQAGTPENIQTILLAVDAAVCCLLPAIGAGYAIRAVRKEKRKAHQAERAVTRARIRTDNINPEDWYPKNIEKQNKPLKEEAEVKTPTISEPLPDPDDEVIGFSAHIPHGRSDKGVIYVNPITRRDAHRKAKEWVEEDQKKHNENK